MNSNNLSKSKLIDYQSIVNEYLHTVLPNPKSDNLAGLTKAMHYAVFNGGKRLRPALTYAIGLDLNAPIEQLNPSAGAIELIHCYSLVHDDLPAMDDDDLRRGKPSCHKEFTESTAILTGNALQSLAFEVIATAINHNIPATTVIIMINKLAYAGGVFGMGGGQALDIAAENTVITIEELETIHQLKTGELISASIVLGALSAGLTNTQEISILAKCAQKVGLAYQIQDDILDITASTATLGKQAKSDITLNKSTYPQLTSINCAQQKVDQLFKETKQLLHKLSFNTNKLQEIFHIIESRKK